MNSKSIGSFIAALRKANGMTQKELAEKLNVSDKAVSRWERDETAPDITLIPVIAELFGVTCDELLRGERKKESACSTVSDETSGKDSRSKKQLKQLLQSTSVRFREWSIASGAVMLLGLLLAALLNSVFIRARAGFLCGAICILIGVACELAAWVSFQGKVNTDELDTAMLNDCRAKLFRILLNTLTFAFLILAFELPLAGAPAANLGLNGWILYGLMYLIFGFIAVYILKNPLVRLIARLAGMPLEHAEHADRKSCWKLFFLILALLAVTVVLQVVVWCVMDSVFCEAVYNAAAPILFCLFLLLYAAEIVMPVWLHRKANK